MFFLNGFDLKSRISLFFCLICFSQASFNSCTVNLEDDIVTDYENTCAVQGTNIQNQNSDYLIMMYLDGDNNLNDCAWKNLIQTQIGLMSVEENQSINIVALIDGNKDEGMYGDGKTHLYWLSGYDASQYSTKHGSVTSLTANNTVEYTNQVDWIYQNGKCEVNMADGKTLYNFLNWCNENFTASKTILVLQTHGGGPYKEMYSSLNESSARAICWDNTDGGSAYLSTADEAGAILKTFGKIDLLVQDACLMCSIEEIYGLQNAVHYLVSSPNITYANTYNYDKMIPFISQCAGEDCIEKIGRKFVDLNKERCQSKSIRQANTSDFDSTCMELSLSLVDCSKSSALENIKNLTAKLALAILEDSKSALAIKSYLGNLSKNDDSAFYGFSFSGTFAYTQDLGVTAYIIANDVNNLGLGTKVKEQALELFNQLKDSSLIIYGWSGGKEHQWYYSGDSNYGYDFLKICDDKIPWGISITSASKYLSLRNYEDWTEFGNQNDWGKILK